jgi:nitrite reductase/ring-hydroxylating ferredoxin subunit
MSLPSAWYCEGEPFQHEKRTLFATEWLLLARTEQLRERGEFVTANLGGWPVFALVDDAGAIGAFRNVCRHQGMQVLEKPRGRCDNVRCRYHGWTYDLSGRMVSAPELVAPADPHSPDNHLVRIARASLDKLVFVNVDPRATPLDAALGALAPELARALAERVPVGEATTDYNCNWKTYVEHCLATRAIGVPADDGVWLWQWPLLMAHVAADAVCVQQVVPRTFARTRVIDHVFVSAVGHGAAPLAAAKARAAADKPACEALQRQREGGDAAADSILADFHRSVHAAFERAPRDGAIAVQGAG